MNPNLMLMDRYFLHPHSPIKTEILKDMLVIHICLKNHWFSSFCHRYSQAFLTENLPLVVSNHYGLPLTSIITFLGYSLRMYQTKYINNCFFKTSIFHLLGQPKFLKGKVPLQKPVTSATSWFKFSFTFWCI